MNDAADAQVTEDHGLIVEHRIMSFGDVLDSDAYYIREMCGWRSVGFSVPILGWIIYPILQVARLVDPVALPFDKYLFPQIGAAIFQRTVHVA